MTMRQRLDVRPVVGTAGGTPVLAAGGRRDANDRCVTHGFGRWFGWCLPGVMKRLAIVRVVRMDDDAPAAGGRTGSWHSGW